MTWGNVLCMILYLITEFVNYLLMYLLIFQMSLNKKRGDRFKFCVNVKN